MKLSDLINDLSYMMENVGDDMQVLFHHVDTPSEKLELVDMVQGPVLYLELACVNSKFPLIAVPPTPTQREISSYATRSYSPRRMM